VECCIDCGSPVEDVTGETKRLEYVAGIILAFCLFTVISDLSLELYACNGCVRVVKNLYFPLIRDVSSPSLPGM
jgi:hypothetical protein